MKFILFLALSFYSFTSSAQASDTKDINTIKDLLMVQTEAWNKGDLNAFMQTYWKSDSLIFIGKNGVKRGWTVAYENYKKGYPDTVAMGKLAFDIIEMKYLSPDYFFVVGKWMLQRSIGDISGHFDLLLRRINGQWVIISDHSS